MKAHDSSQAHDPPASSAFGQRNVPLLIESISLCLLNEPLDYILADHARMRKICAALLDIASTHVASRLVADTLTAYLTGELTTHHADEDEDLAKSGAREGFCMWAEDWVPPEACADRDSASPSIPKWLAEDRDWIYSSFRTC